MATHSWEGCATARAGVAGNPSDALGGAALAVPVPGLRARVELRRADRLTVRGAAGPAGWASPSDLAKQVALVGHDGGDRLVTAAIVTLHRHLVGRGEPPDDEPFSILWRTDIPRSVGLAGSSALVIATLRALVRRWGVTLEPAEMARVALDAERVELGIAAGWMDRAVQCLDAPTLVDVRTDPDAEVPAMSVVRPPAPVELLVVWNPGGAAPSGRLHRSLRSRLDAGDPTVVEVVRSLAETAERAADALARGDEVALAEMVRRSCGLRDRLGALDPPTAALVHAAVDAGGTATSAGSGGAALVVPLHEPASSIRSALERDDLQVAPVPLEPVGGPDR